MQLRRPLRGGETGADVRALQRALNRWASGAVPIPLTGTFGRTTRDRLLAFQLEQGVKPAAGELDQQTLDRIWPWFDRYGRWRYRRYRPPTPEDRAFAVLVSWMRRLSDASAGYRLGAGHGVPLARLRPDDLYDCSSSTSKVLWEAGLFPDERAWVSGTIAARYGRPGRGRRFTVWANAEHVWIQLHRTRWARFDTSPHADGRPSEDPRRGPRLRYLPRSSAGFVPRHWEGM